MGKKYIIELNPDCVEGEYLRIPARIAGEQQWLMTKAALTPCAELDLVQIRKDAYAEGYKEGMQLSIDDAKLKEEYQQGLNDAWDAARKIAELDTDEQKKLFGCFGISFVAHEFSAHEAIKKIRQYKQEKEKQIQVGDEVIATSGKAVIVWINDDKDKARYIYHDSTLGIDKVCNLSKTGRHFPEIAAVLEKMRGEQE